MDIAEGVLPGEKEVEERKEDKSMNKEPGEHSNAVPAQLLPQCARILHVQDLPRHQKDNPKWKIPGRTEHHYESYRS